MSKLPEQHLKHLAPHELALLRWHLQRSPLQSPPTPLPFIWFLLGGRGSGKTKTAANHIFEQTILTPSSPQTKTIRIALIGETFNDGKATMVEGETGLLSVIPPSLIIAWNRTTGELKYKLPPASINNTYREVHANVYSSERPDQLRGPQFHLAWIDEPAKLKDSDENPKKEGTTFSNLMFGLRLGEAPHLIASGTPTPCQLVKHLISHSKSIISKMTSWDNREHLPQNYRDELEALDPQSRTARQEIYAEVLDDNPDALFFQELINSARTTPTPEINSISYKVLGWDPSTTSGEDSDEAGLILTQYTPKTKLTPTQAYILEDLSNKLSPTEQTQLVIYTILTEQIDDLVFERNQGSDYILIQLEQELLKQTKEYSIRKLRPKRSDYGPIARFRVKTTNHKGEFHQFTINAIHASKGKKVRAEIVSMKYDSQQVHHPTTPLIQLENQMTSWNPVLSNKSPDRLDGLVYALLHIFGSKTLRTPNPGKLSGPPNINLDQIISSAPKPRLERPSKVSIYSVDIAPKRGPQ